MKKNFIRTLAASVMLAAMAGLMTACTSYDDNPVIVKPTASLSTPLTLEAIEDGTITFRNNVNFLRIVGGELTSVDVSKNTKLKLLHILNNQLTDIDVSQNPVLENIALSNNQLTKIDISKNPELFLLAIADNKVSSIDLSNNRKIEELNVGNNLLTELDVTGLSEMYFCGCYGNQLTTLDVTGCDKLKIFTIYNNRIKGDGMTAIINSMPTVKSGYFEVINKQRGDEQNVITDEQIAAAQAKGWTVEITE